MIVGDITRFTNKGMGLAMRVLAAGLAALLALTFLNLTVLPGTALAEEADGVDAATEHLVLPAPEEPEAGSNVFVYLHLNGPALDTAKAAGLEVNREGWFTVGVIALKGIAKPSEKPLNYEVDQTELKAMQNQIGTALRSINYYPGAQALSLSAAKWTALKVCSGATDYAVAGHTWHLDGELCDQLVNFDVRYIDAEGNALAVGDVDDQGNKTDTRTILAAVGSEIAADDQIIDIEGYEYSKELTTEKNGGESVTVAAESLARSSVSGMTLVYKKTAEEPVKPENPGDNDPAGKPVVPDDNGNGSVDNNGGVKPPAPSDNETPRFPRRPHLSSRRAMPRITTPPPVPTAVGSMRASARLCPSPRPRPLPRRSSLPKRLLPSSLQPRRFPSTMMQHRWLLESAAPKPLPKRRFPWGPSTLRLIRLLGSRVWGLLERRCGALSPCADVS